MNYHEYKEKVFKSLVSLHTIINRRLILNQKNIENAEYRDYINELRLDLVYLEAKLIAIRDYNLNQILNNIEDIQYYKTVEIENNIYLNK